MSQAALVSKRGNAKGQITRTGTYLTSMKAKLVREWKLTNLTRYQQQLEKSSQEYQKAHEALEQYMEPGEMDAYHADEEEHGNALDNLLELTEFLESGIKAWASGTHLSIALKNLKGNLEGGYGPTLEPQYTRIETGILTFTDILACNGIREQPEIQLLHQQVMAEWYVVDQSRRDSGYLTSPGGVAPATPAVSAAMRRHTTGVTVKPPSFSGKVTDYQDFKTLFLDVMSKQTQLADAERNAVLLECMSTAEAKERARTAIKLSTSFSNAMARLSKRYENHTELVAHHLSSILALPVVDQDEEGIQLLIQAIGNHVSGLKQARCTSMEQVVTALADDRMNPKLRLAWRTFSASSEDPPGTDMLADFLEEQERIVSRSTATPILARTPHQARSGNFSRKRSKPPQESVAPPQERAGTEETKKIFAMKGKVCHFCQEPHTMFACTGFREKTPTQRQEWTKAHKRCFNCLSDHHTVADCTSEKRCQECANKHHTLLHLPHWKRKRESSPAKAGNNNHLSAPTVTPAIMVTALIAVSAGRNRRYARALIDSGAELTAISESFARSLQAQANGKPPMTIGGVGEEVSPYAINLTLHGEGMMAAEDTEIPIEARVMHKIAQPTSSDSLSQFHSHSFLEGCPLSDPEYRPGQTVDMLLDSGTWYKCRLEGTRHCPGHNVVADSTIFGWVLGGSRSSKPVEKGETPCIRLSQADRRLESLLEQQWVNEAMPNDHRERTQEDVVAEDSFQSTYSQLEDGRHRAGMLVLDTSDALGESRTMALQRYKAVQRSLSKKGLWEEYLAAVADFIQQGHAELVPEEDLKKPPSQSFYMPMHAILKPTSTSTKVRPVCDASAASSTGVSYNDTLATGPNLYPSLTSLVTQFREPAVAMTADITKMYRQIDLYPPHRDFHRFFFSFNDSPPRVYRMTCVTFGVKSSPYVACRVLKQMAQDKEEQYPLAARVLKSQFYMDDVLTGADTLEEAQAIRTDLNDLLETGHFTLCKWRTSSAALRKTIPLEKLASTPLQLSGAPGDQAKALGIHWDTDEDALHIATPKVEPKEVLTKRQLLSITAQLYDPLGWFAPAIMIPRILAQEAWRLRTGWDEALPQEMKLTWKGWLEEIPALTEKPVPRHLGIQGKSSIHRELHGFGDASDKAYGGVVYLKTRFADGTVRISLITSKGRVAPLKLLTTPRLELCAAVVTTRLLQQVAQDLNVEKEDVHGWSDSTIVLAWLRHSPSKLNVFVANRVALIQEQMQADRWRHVPGLDNPADCLSRGMRPQDLCRHSLWWNGPEWLTGDPEQWPPAPTENPQNLPEIRSCIQQIQAEVPALGHGQTSFTTWVRVVAWIRRFWSRITRAKDQRTEPFLTAPELLEAQTTVMRASQREGLKEELETLKGGKPLNKHHCLARVTPYIDPQDDLMKVGGRLANSDLPATTIHPLILHAKTHTVYLMIVALHQRMLHPPLSALLATVAYTYHVIRLRPVVKSIVSKCVTCQRKWARPVRQKMGDLPAFRCSQGAVFAHTGIDYAGPIMISRGSGYSRVKAYIALFICMLSRAVHLELVFDATTAAFLAALDRFCGRRGVPSRIQSDNGGNFVGAYAELRCVMQELHSDQATAQRNQWCANQGIHWDFSPAYSPHFGGLWEAGVKSVKDIINERMAMLKLTANEVQTLLVSAEAILNSRPYVPVFSTDPDAVCPLTPGHLLIGRPLCALPQRLDPKYTVSNVKHWNLVKLLQHQHWELFRKQYLTQLSRRAKEIQEQGNLEVGDVVLLPEVGTRRNRWPLGRVNKTYPGPDGLVRVVDVKAHGSIYRRAVKHLIKMPITTETPRSRA